MENMLTEVIAEATRIILDAGALTIRDVAGGEEAFLYSSGNKGPGYITIKGLPKRAMRKLVQLLADKVSVMVPNITFVVGNATGGMIPGYELSNCLEEKLGRYVPSNYARDTRKKGGHREWLTGNELESMIVAGSSALVVEELVNFAETTCNSAIALREAGYAVTHAACILSYDHQAARNRLAECDIDLIYLCTLEHLLSAAEDGGYFAPHLVADFRDFLRDPSAWMAQRGLTRDEQGGTL